MRKRLAIIFCMLMISICGLVGCGNDPYANMRIALDDGLTTDSIQRLYITQTSEGGNTVYNYDEAMINFTVKVSGVDSGVVDTRVTVSGWEGYIQEPVIDYIGDGVSRIVSKPLSETSTGKFTLKVQTNEGNQSLSVDFQIDLKLINFYFNEEALEAVSSSYEICLDEMGGLIDYYPSATTQKKIEYSVAVPTLNTSTGNYSIYDRLDGNNVIYHVEGNFIDYGEYKYAEVVTDSLTGKQILKVYPYLMTSAGTYAQDSEGNLIPSSFPKIQTETTGSMEGVFYDCITLRAHSLSGDTSITDKFLDIEVVPSAGDVVFSMNSQLTEDNVVINKDRSGNYNVVLIDPDYKGGLLTADEMSYYSERDLNFAVANPLADFSDSIYLDEYEVIASNVMPDDNLPVDISMIGERDNFRVSALTAGTYTHTFTVEHKRYRGLFTQEIKVTFKVLDIPFKISVNGNTISSAESNDIVTTIYNVYPRGSYGTKFRVDTGSNFKYFVFYTSDQIEKFSDGGLTLRRDGDGASVVFASGDLSDGNVVDITSTIEGQDFTCFAPSSNFFLSHNLESLPDDVTTIHIGIMFSMADSSYSEDVVENYFSKTLISYPINLMFENGLKEINFDSDNYKINLDNESYTFKQNSFGEIIDYDTGLKLFDLPAGRTYESTIKSLTYDEDLIAVYSVLDEETKVTSLYIKCVEGASVGKTQLVVESYNGLVESVLVETYIPTIYQYNGEVLDGDTPRMPLGIELDKYSSGYLYHMSGLDNANHELEYTLYSSLDDTIGFGEYYNSVESLFMITNAEQRLSFYDFRIVLDEYGMKTAEGVDITSEVKVTFNYPQYASYKDGVIRTNSLVTLDKNSPIIMTITYTGGYEQFDASGKPVYSTLLVKHKIRLFIYEPLDGVEVTTSKTVDLFISNSLGCYNEDLSRHTIVSTFIPNEIQLGAEWNGSDEWNNTYNPTTGQVESWNPVELRYEYADLLLSPILNKYGEEIKIYSANSSGYRVIYYQDLFVVTVDSVKFECTVQNVMSDDLMTWLMTNGYTSIDRIEGALKQIFKDNIEFYVNIYINQFNRLQNINSVRFIANYADRIGQLKLDIEEDGVYFEIKDGATSTIEIAYTIDNASVINKDIVLASYDTLLYHAEVIPNATGNSGKIIITSKTTAGVGEILITTADNIKDINENGEFSYYRADTNLIKSFRIKVADGTKQYPFEIRSVQDYKEMIADAEAGNYYYYVITRDINLSGYDQISSVNITNNTGSVFSLSGKHTYYRNGEQITTYSTLYNLVINQTINNAQGNVNIGLFGELGEFVQLDNISISNAVINVIDNLQTSTQINVGILAGTVNGSKITASSVAGSIRVIRNTETMTSTISVGGMVGRAINTTTITDLPGEYEDGIVSTGNTSYVDIELALGDSLTAENSLASKTMAGGLIGYAVGSTTEDVVVNNVQVVSNITSVIRASIGGIVGVIGQSGYKSATITNAYIIPSIVANISTELSVDKVNFGGIIGLAQGQSYTLENSIVNFLDVGDDNYTWQNRISIFVSATSGTEVIFGGLVGNELAIAKSSKYNYVRSYYERDIDDGYKGNVYIVASMGSVGGLVGKSYTNSHVERSYFDGDITASESLNAGMLVGSINGEYTIKYVYGIGYLNDIVLTQDGDDYIYTMSSVAEVDGNSGIFGNVPFEENGDELVYTNASLHALNTYAVVNGNINYFAEEGKIIGICCLDNGNAITLPSKVGRSVYEYLVDDSTYGYAITLGEDANLTEYEWFWNSAVNTVKVGESTVAYPVLLNGSFVMFDLVPNAITAMINEREGLYNITYNNIPQVVMFINRLSKDNTSDNTYYDISLNKESSAFEIKLDGAVVSTTYVNLNNLKMNDKVEFLENSNESIIRIVGNRIYPVSTGVATLTIRSYVAKSVKAVISIAVVDGMTDYELIANNTTIDELTNYISINDYLDDSSKVIYIDELTSFYLASINISADYVANSNYGFVLELLDAGDDVDNGIIKIGDVEYTYDSSDVSKNILVFNARDFKISGVKLGRVKFVITPFITLSGVEFVDNYISINSDSYSISLSNVYLLDSSNSQKVYCFNILARAISIENTRTEISLDSTNKVSFSTIIETANVHVENIDDSTAEITILENVTIKINNKYSAIFNLSNVKFTCTISGSQYICTGTNFKLDGLGYEFDYTLINIIFSSMTIVKTNINSIARNNTYKISFGGSINFDRDYYRANADLFDLNSAVFNIVITPDSNSNISATTVVTIVPKEISAIFTNFYTKMESVQAGEYNEYPTENESIFTVPGRDGLLKVTLGEEFNNSSYVTITLNKKYYGYVSIQQLAAVVDAPASDYETGDILGYQQVISLENIDMGSTFGIKLSKLSLNYNDTNYFNNTYYIKLLVDKNITETTLDMDITSYSVYNNEVTEQLTETCSLQILELPTIYATLDGEQYSVLGRGVRKELNINYKGLTENINFGINEVSNIDCDNDKVFITDDEGLEVFELSIDYLSDGRKYYINQDVTTPTGCIFEIEFWVTETILGVLEETECLLYFDTVEVEVESLKLFGVTDALYIKFGENVMVDTQLTIKDIVVGEKSDIDNYLLELEDVIRLAEYEFAGTRVSRYEDNQEEVLSSGILSLQYRQVIGEEIVYTDISYGNYGGITITQDFYKEDNYSYKYFEIIGTEIGSDTYLRLDADYYYSDGKLVVGNDAINVYNYTIDVLIVVEDNSTYDHPIPVEDANKLLSVCGVENGNFILVNNIELENWVPQEAKFDTLDGNGYTITIKSFNLSSIRGESSADVGIFSIVSENTLLKNLLVDVSDLLKGETAMSNDIAKMRASTKDSYVYRDDIIDLGYIQELNFGIIAGTNNGAITNAKVVSTKNVLVDNGNSSAETGKYLHILTTQGYDDGSLIVSNIGGLVGVNGETGAITNSFVGVNASNSKVVNDDSLGTVTQYYVHTVTNPSETQLENNGDQLEEVQIYPFVLAGGNNLGGLVCTNNGIISNCYAKGLGVYNTYPTVGDSATAGLVTYNNNVITSTFVEGNEIEDYRAVDNDYRLESTGYIGGLVYQNNATIENSYSNAYVQTLSSFMGGFVFTNSENATISNCYSTAVNRNSLATGQFTGVKQGVVQNFGTFNNCYYLVDSAKGEFANVNEDAVAICSDSNSFDDMGLWNGFAFVSGANVDGIWTIEEGQTPKIATLLTDTISFRRLTGTELDATIGVIYNYIYDSPYYLGTKENPLIIDKAENFDIYIIDSAYPVDGDEREVFGYRESEYASRYVRVVNNLDFEQITTAQEHKGTYLYKVVFAGVLDGNGMTFSNLNINTDSTELENFGLFAQIGYEKCSAKSVIKNINFNVRTFKSAGNSKTGILAGTIVNSSIVNVKINGGNQTISGLNMSGALAGLIYATNNLDVTLIDVSVENVRVEATHGSLGGSLSARSEDMSSHFFNSFSIERNGQQSTTGYSFKSLYDAENGTVFSSTDSQGITTNYVQQVSYAGGVAGVLLANNYSKELSSTGDVISYRTKAQESTIENVVVSGNVVLSTADNAGGLFGYIGENTLVRNSKLIVSDGQLLKAFNNIGGIVGENHGVLEQCTVAYEDATQAEYDATVASDSRDNGTFNLFDMAEGEPYYAVSIGGIAGYSQDGIIIDSYSKVNVTKALSYIAGGIIGYARGYNYLGYVYNTGAVYAKYVMGGIIGLQVNDYDANNSQIANRVYLDKVVSLTNWNATSDTFSVRDEITKRLYEDQKYMYSKEGTLGYNNFYIKMPELGNAPIEYGDESIDLSVSTAMNEEYRLAHSSYYVGSTIGKAIIKNENTVYNGDNTALHVFSDYSVIEDLFGDLNTYTDADRLEICSEVFSSTFGMVTTEGSVESGTSNDDYFKNSFSIEIGEDVTINSLSYRIAYPTKLNNYSLVLETTNDNDYLDRFVFDRVFSSQEYIQQLLGESYTYQEGDSANASTFNIFRYGTEWDSTEDLDNGILAGYDRYVMGGIDGEGKFVDGNANIWDITDYLPKYASGVATAIEFITKSDKTAEEWATALDKAFRNSSTGKTYQITEDITLDLYENDYKYIKYYGGVKSLFIGDEDKPTITINLTNGSGTTYLASVFNILSGAVLQNLNINIVVSKSNYTNLKIDTENYGIFANTLDGVQINNCDFTITVNNSIEFNSNDDVFKATNLGVLFGAVNNSSITDSTFKIVASNINLNHDNIANFGLLAGSVSRTSFTNCQFTINNTSIVISECADTISIGGLVGNAYSTKFTNFKQYITNNDTVTITDNYTAIAKSIGALFGTATQLTMSTIQTDSVDGKDSTISSLTYTPIVTEVGQLNIALFAGKSEASKINNVVLSANTKLTINGENSISNELNIGSIIGYEVKNSQLGKSGVVGSYSPITSILKAYSLNVGGIIGLVGTSQQLLNNTFADNTIDITNNNSNQIVTVTTDKNGNEVENYSYATSYVGGLVGYASGRIGLDGVVSIASVSLIIAENAEDNSLRASVGGIMGGANSSVYIDNFASLSDISLNKLDYEIDNVNGYYETYLGGVIGYNNGIFVGSNGYSYVQLPRDDSDTAVDTTIKSSIVNGVVSTSDNVYYALEFMGNNYSSDVKHIGYAMGDLYGTISEYSSIYNLTQVNGMSTQNLGNIQVVIPTSIVDGGYITRLQDSTVNDKYNLYNIETSTTDIKTYNVISDNLGDDNTGFGGWTTSEGVRVIKNNVIVSGRSVDDGKVIVHMKSETSSTTRHFVETNNGVLSNIYLCTGVDGDINNLALVGVNNGLITNVMVYGLSYCNYAIANTNNGEIYSSVSSIKYMPRTTNATLYGLVLNNNASGVISDCYSSSFGYTESQLYKTTVYGFAQYNYGTIEYSTYYIPSDMQYDNVAGGYHETLASNDTTDDNAVIKGCYYSQIPSSLLRRSNVWTEENAHIQVRGMKDPEGSVVVRIYIQTISDANAEITSVEELKTKVSTSEDYILSYDYDFYVEKDNMPSYRVVRISSGSALIEYVNSLTNGYIPTNTIVLITNDLTASSDSHIFKINATQLNRISLSQNSAIIGINTNTAEGTTGNMILSFGSEKSYGLMDHELININRGLIAGINVEYLELKKVSATPSFAPIMQNDGSIVNVNFVNVNIKGMGASYVSGLVDYNSKTGIIYKCKVDSCYIYSLTWVSMIYHTNDGGSTAINAVSSPNTTYAGNLLGA